MNRMDSRKKHPFAITCRKCGSNRATVYAYDYQYLGIKCKSCGFFFSVVIMTQKKMIILICEVQDG